MNRVELFEIKRLACTNTKGTRVNVKDVYMNTKKILDYDYEIGDILEQGKRYLESQGKEILGYSEGKDSYFIITK